MFTLLTAYVDNARRRLAEHNARAALDDYPTAAADEAYGDEFEYYGDEQTAAGDVGLEHDNKDRIDDAAGSGQELASIDDLRELERHLGMGSGGSDGSMTEIDDTPAPDAERLGAEERARRAGENVDWAAMGDKEREASFSVWDQIVRIAAEDRRIADEKERRRRELECGPNCVHCTADSDSDSDSDAGSTREGSDSPTVSALSNKSDDGRAAARAGHSPPPDAADIYDEARERSPTPDVYAAPLADPVLPPRKQKRARSDDDDDAADALWEKRRRVDTEEQPGSPRPRAGRHNDRNQNGAGSSSAATRSTHQIHTAASTAPQHQLEGATVAGIQYAADWSRLCRAPWHRLQRSLPLVLPRRSQWGRAVRRARPRPSASHDETPCAFQAMEVGGGTLPPPASTATSSPCIIQPCNYSAEIGKRT